MAEVAGRLYLDNKVILFDLDGVIVDSSKFEKPIVEEMVGQEIDQEVWNKAFPLTIKDFLIKLNKDLGLNLNKKELKKIAKELKRARLNNPLPLIPGVKEIIIDAFNQDIVLGVVSNNKQKDIERVLKNVDLLNYFQVVVGIKGNEKKPDPSIYLKAIEAIGTNKALAIEDSAIGIWAAKGAGLKTVSFSEVNQEADINYLDFSKNIINIYPGQITKKSFQVKDPFIAHMVEHICLRVGVGVDINWSNDDYFYLGKKLIEKLRPYLILNKKGLASIDESLSLVQLKNKKPGVVLNIDDWFLKSRVEELNSPKPLIDLLEGVADALGKEIVVTSYLLDDPHHVFESIFRALGSAFAPGGQGVYLPKKVITATRDTKESSVNVSLNSEFSVTIDTAAGQRADLEEGLEELLSGLEIFRPKIGFESKELFSSHVVFEDIGIVLGQAFLKLATSAIEKRGINGFGFYSGKHNKISLSLEGRSGFYQIPVDTSLEAIRKESINKNLASGLYVEDLDDFFYGFSQGMGLTICLTRTERDPSKEWPEIFNIFSKALINLFSINNLKRGAIAGTKGTLK